MLVVLGRWPLLTVDAARAQAQDLLRRMADGEAPATLEAGHAARPTFADALGDYLAAQSPKAGTAQRTPNDLATQAAGQTLGRRGT